MDEFIKNLFKNFDLFITDHVFLTIQNDRNLMQQYLKLIEKKGINAINQRIGREIKKKYNLSNFPKRNKKPISTLISSHQIFQNDIF